MFGKQPVTGHSAVFCHGMKFLGTVIITGKNFTVRVFLSCKINYSLTNEFMQGTSIVSITG